jgi:nitroreductase
MEFNEVVEKRYSAREYRRQPVPEPLLERVLAAIDAAPSAVNLQSFKVVVVTDEAKRRRIAELCGPQEWMIQAPVFLCFFSDPDNYRAARGENPRAERLSFQDATIAAAYAQLAATDAGLATCWVGRGLDAPIGQFLGLPPSLKFAAVITLGYAADVPEPRERKGPAAWCIRER